MLVLYTRVIATLYFLFLFFSFFQLIFSHITFDDFTVRFAVFFVIATVSDILSILSGNGRK